MAHADSRLYAARDAHRGGIACRAGVQCVVGKAPVQQGSRRRIARVTSSDTAAALRTSRDSAPMMTQINVMPSRSAVADTQNPALAVEPVFSPLQPR